MEHKQPGNGGVESRSFPIPPNEADRVSLLREFDFLYDEQREGLTKICRLARDLLGVRSAFVTLVDSDELRFLNRDSSDTDAFASIPRCDAMCAHTIMQDTMMDVPDLALDPRFAQFPGVSSWPFLRFYVGIPLVLEGLRIGTLCMMDHEPRALSDVERHQVKTMADLAVDIMQMHRTKQALKRSEKVLAQSSRLAKFGGWEHDLVSHRRSYSSEYRSILGLEPARSSDLELMRAGLSDEDRVRVHDARERLEGAGEPFDLEFAMTTPAGERRWIRSMGECEWHDGHKVRLFGAVQDITDRKLAEQRIEHLAHHDPLTGLANRTLFRQRLIAAIDRATTAETKFSVMLVDFDGFKDINDRRGHAAGDAILEASAERMQLMGGPTSTVARLGGDEFAVLLEDIGSEERVSAEAERFVAALKQPVLIAGDQLAPSASIGVTVFPEDARSPTDLLKNADIAMYLAKSAGGGSVGYFTPSLRQKYEDRLHLLEGIRRGIAAGEFSLHFQPICAVHPSGETLLKGFEALMRWQHPQLGLLTPTFFGMAFNEPEFANLLGAIGLDQAFKQILDWTSAGVDFGYVALNIAQGQFAAPEFLPQVAARIKAAGLPAGSLMLEVTESVYLGNDAERICADLAKLHELGVRVALDDFGTGYASLTHLRQFPVDLMKIDRSFVQDIGRDKDNSAIARAVINLGQALGIDIVAEGVETDDQRRFLTANGCEAMQGYLFAQAMPAGDVVAFVRSLKSTEAERQRLAS